MYVLDTDTTSNFLARDRNYEALRRRILALPPGQVFISIVTVEEILRGQLSVVNTARSRNDGAALIRGYRFLQELHNALHAFPVLPYDEAADQRFQELDKNLRRKHGHDCRISAITAARGMIVITRNLNDYQKIGLAPCDDWT